MFSYRQMPQQRVGGGGGGSNLQWYINRENVVSPGNEILHQHSRIISSKSSHTDIHKIQRCQRNTSLSCGLNIFDENGGYSKSENGRGQGNLGKSFEWGITTTAE